MEYCNKCPERLDKVIGFGCSGFVRGIMVNGVFEVQCFATKYGERQKWLQK